MAVNVFDSFLKEFEQPITAFVSTSVSNLATYIDGPLRTAVTLYVILYGFAVMRGAISEPIMEFAWRAMRIVVVVLLATNSSAFQQYVTSLFFDSLPKEIGNALAGSGLNTSSGAPFDQLLSKGIDVANKIYDQAGITDVAPALIAGILLVFVAVGSFLQFAILLYAKVGLGVVIALGPIFIALGLFEATRPFTEAWLRQLANFVILLVLVVALVGLMLTTVSGFIDRFGANAGTAGEMVVAAVAISAVLGLSGYIALQLPTIAGGLAGGGASLASRLVTNPLVANATAAAGGAYAGARWSAGRGLAALKASRQGGSMQRAQSQGTRAA
ncbi:MULTISPECIES: type IV secretion system protein [Bradyrhizobium]|uniref:type IV secretion system protein n=1 Tax=Bradyrhizobium TaxID=374 RepID=UPI0004AF61BE|nr:MULTISPECIES: type IV secretion system protein [Bradyrhizobium]MCW2130510.1 type IV secretion system protein VirB6 [Bradyrhizobium elkanii]MCW2175820.1 type IV secretion system protein VirB6 [Bradyrhizobium elkanii]MDI2108526.1 type IV secretion system protein [Bradyrhizobium sp. Mp64]